ncbi:hypothetical protein HMI54_014396 [Coelomomyces lativittatus]|nr:hypothetical protein HMI55_000143 [Coelomomyces lativittatus]KAJ1515182.1 hypothetical protein HMI56_006374 [Coelomomyces lativittatus]KAJ1518617.1 hypothetical protein HMI54_014396 [Coelomomyces lativittatus]
MSSSTWNNLKTNSQDFVLHVPSENLNSSHPSANYPRSRNSPISPTFSEVSASSRDLQNESEDEENSGKKNINENLTSSSSNSKLRCFKSFPYWLVCLLRAIIVIVVIFALLGLPDIFFGLKINENENRLPFQEWTSSVHIGGMPTLFWAFYLSVSCLIYYSTLMVVSFLPIFIEFILSKSLDPAIEMKVEEYLNCFRAIRISLSVTVWLAFSFLTWSLFVMIPDWRWKREWLQALPPDSPIWYSYVFRALLSFTALSALWATENFLLEFIASRFHLRAYRDRIKESEKMDLIIKKLLVEKNIKKYTSVFQSRNSVSNLNKARSYIWNTAKLTLLASQEVTKQSLDASILITLKCIPDTLEKANQLAEALFLKLSRGQQAIQVTDFLPYFESSSKAKRAFKFFDKDNNGDLSFEELQSRLFESTQEKIHLTKSMKDMKAVVSSLHYFIGSLFFFVGILLVCMIFQITVATYISTIAAILLPSTFIFGSTLKETFECIISIFIKNYYDVGDMLLIDKEIFMVISISILTTVLERRDGKRVFAPNNVLNSKMIDNIRRSGFMSEEIEIKLDIATTQEQLNDLTSRMTEFLNSDPKFYFPTFSVTIKDVLLNEKTLRCAVYLSYRFNWQEMGRKAQKRNAFMYALTENIKAIGITCSYPLQTHLFQA